MGVRASRGYSKPAPTIFGEIPNSAQTCACGSFHRRATTGVVPCKSVGCVIRGRRSKMRIQGLQEHPRLIKTTVQRFTSTFVEDLSLKGRNRSLDHRTRRTSSRTRTPSCGALRSPDMCPAGLDVLVCLSKLEAYCSLKIRVPVPLLSSDVQHDAISLTSE